MMELAACVLAQPTCLAPAEAGAAAGHSSLSHPFQQLACQRHAHRQRCRCPAVLQVDAVFCCLPHATTQLIIKDLPEHLKVRPLWQ